MKRKAIIFSAALTLTQGHRLDNNHEEQIYRGEVFSDASSDSDSVKKISMDENTLRFSCQNVCGQAAPIFEDPTWDTTFMTTCSCEEKCKNDPKGCCSDYHEVCQSKKPWLDYDTCEERLENYGTCPEDFEDTLILVSLDGFRVDYLERKEFLPHITKLRECGVSVPYQRSSYPTVTFPNHFSIVSGLYTESHGIVGNSFQSIEKNDYYSAFDSRDEKSDGRWYNGEPIWNTVRKQEKISATYMWPASDKNVNDMFANHYYNFSSEAPYPHRVQAAMEWLDLPKEERPTFINMYFDEPDHGGHYVGLEEYEAFNPTLRNMDGQIKMLIDALDQRGLLSCVNIVIGADHGMAKNSKNDRSFIDDYTEPGYCDKWKDYDNDDNFAYCYTGTQATIGPKLYDYDKQFSYEKEWSKFQCSRPAGAHWWAYRGDQDLPRRLHYQDNNDRIPYIVMLMEDEYYSSKNTKSSYSLVGNHGYDNQYDSMRALFVAYWRGSTHCKRSKITEIGNVVNYNTTSRAMQQTSPSHGSAFKQQLTTDYVHQNIELYNMFCKLTGVSPAPNNGTSGSMNHILADRYQVDVEIMEVESVKGNNFVDQDNNWGFWG